MIQRPKRQPRARAQSEAQPIANPRIAELTDDVFDALLQLSRLEEGELPDPEVLHRQLRVQLESIPKKASGLGYSREDGKDILYALVAFADETAINSAPSLSEYWQENLLQMKYFEENRAGENFFTRLENIRKHSDRADVLLAYYFCLTLGFKGQYRVQQGGDAELMEIIASVRETLVTIGLSEPDVLSPHGERTEETAKIERRRLSLLAIPVAMTVLSLIAYLLLGSVQPAIDDTIKTISEITGGQ